MPLSEETIKERYDRTEFDGEAVLGALLQSHKLAVAHRHWKVAEHVMRAIIEFRSSEREDDREHFTRLSREHHE